MNGLKAEKGKCRSPQATCRGSGGVPQYKFPLSRARERGIKGVRVRVEKNHRPDFIHFCHHEGTTKTCVLTMSLVGEAG